MQEQWVLLIIQRGSEKAAEPFFQLKARKRFNLKVEILWGVRFPPPGVSVQVLEIEVGGSIGKTNLDQNGKWKWKLFFS